MGYPRPVQAIPPLIIVGVLLTADQTTSSSGTVHAPSPSVTNAQATTEPFPLVGTWVFLSTEDPAPTRSAIPGNSIKVVTERGFHLTRTHPETGDVLFHHGGSYTLDGTDYTETIEFANAANQSLINQMFRFKIEIQKDTFRQVGVGNRWTEVWRRLIARAPASQVPPPVLACESSPEGRSALLELNRTAGRGLQTLPETAVTKLLVAVEDRPTVATPYLDLARCYYTQRQRSDAALSLSRGLALIRQARSAEASLSLDSAQLRSGEPVSVGGAIKKPSKIKDQPATYPDDAARTRVTGVVVVEAVVGRNGRVRSAQIVRSVPMLDDAALQSVRQWEYEPTIVDDQPVDVVMHVTVKFGAASPTDGIDTGRFFFERRQYAQSEEAVAQALAMINSEIQRVSRPALFDGVSGNRDPKIVATGGR